MSLQSTYFGAPPVCLASERYASTLKSLYTRVRTGFLSKMDSNRYIDLLYHIQSYLIVCCCLPPLPSELTVETPTRRDSILKEDILFLFSIQFNQGIRPSSSIAAQLTSRAHAEEASDTLTRYYGGRRNDGVDLHPLYSG